MIRIEDLHRLEQKKQERKQKVEALKKEILKTSNIRMLISSFIVLIIAAGGIFMINGEVTKMESFVENGQWTCISERCVNTVTGDDWIANKCSYEEEELVCEVNYQGQDMTVPLKNINVSTASACIEYECAVEVFVRNT